jgi:RHS repeat-associated protein
VQNLHYTYDPAGNITHIRDEAQQTIYFRNTRVEPSAKYTYDAIYRLIEATGREHLGQVGGAPVPHSYNDAPRVGLLHPGDGNAMGRYLERYLYDAVGNFLSMEHRGSDPAHPGWTEAYAYDEPSQLEPAKVSNRLTRTTAGGTTETYSVGGDGYDAHGSMLHMPQLHVMQWNFKDQLQMTQRQAVNPEDADGVAHHGERTWYVYDAAGQRVRKVAELASDQVKHERIYLGIFEIYRKNGVNPLVRETLHIMDGRQRVALVETPIKGNDAAQPQLIRYQFGNHLGSAILELDDQAQIISYEEYAPYGCSTYQAVRSRTEESKRYRYTGKERDEENGLYYYGARYGAPWIGRWINPDPSGLADGLNLYSVTRHNPTTYIDRTGRQTTKSASPEKSAIAEWDRENAVIWLSEQVLTEIAANRKRGTVLGSAEVESLAHEFAHVLQSKHIMDKYESRGERATEMRRETVERILQSTEDEYVQHVLAGEEQAERTAQTVRVELLDAFSKKRGEEGFPADFLKEVVEERVKQFMEQNAASYKADAQKAYRTVREKAKDKPDAPTTIAAESEKKEKTTQKLVPVASIEKSFPPKGESPTLDKLLEAMKRYNVMFVVSLAIAEKERQTPSTPGKTTTSAGGTEKRPRQGEP